MNTRIIETKIVATKIENNSRTEENSKWLMLLLFGLAHSNESFYAPSLHIIAKSLSSSNNLSMVSSFFSYLGFSAGMLFFGRMSDLFGRKIVLKYGIISYCITSFLFAFVNDLGLFLTLRLIQSFNISCCSCVTQAILRDSYSGNRLSSIYAFISSAITFIPSVLSGISLNISENFGWKYNMLLIEVFAFIAMFFVLKNLRETNKFINETQEISYAKILFTMISDKRILLYTAIMICGNGIFFGFLIEMPFLFIDTLKISKKNYGILLISFALMLFFAGQINIYLIKKISILKIMNLGYLILIFSQFLMLVADYLFLSNNENFIYAILFSRTLYMYSHSFIIPHIMRLALDGYQKVNGTASAIFGFMYYFGLAISNFIVSIIHRDGEISHFCYYNFFLAAASFGCFLVVKNAYKTRKEIDFK